MPTSNNTGAVREVDTIIHARWVLPMTAQREILESHGVVMEGQRIVDVLPSDIINTRYLARQEFQLGNHLLMPGLINAHGHSPMTLFRGFADDMPLKPWLEEKIWPAEDRWVSEEFVYDGARLAMAEMLSGGITCFSDMYFFPDQIAKAALESKIRAQLASPVLDFPTVWARNADEYIHKVTLLHDEYRNNEYIHVCFGPHASYTVSDEPLKKISMLADELDIPIHIHLHENAQEIEDSLQHDGFRPIRKLKNLGLLSPRLQAVHMTQLDDDEIELLAQSGVSVVHCPASNLKLASGQCPVTRLLEAGINVCLGTDGAASNNDLDIINEMHLAALLAKVTASDACAVNAWQAIEMATINGARAMGLEDSIGSLETGKLADLVALDLNHASTQPVYDVTSTLVYSASASQVSHVWVGGQLTVDHGKNLTLDTGQIIAKAQNWAQRIKCDN